MSSIVKTVTTMENMFWFRRGKIKRTKWVDFIQKIQIKHFQEILQFSPLNVFSVLCRREQTAHWPAEQLELLELTFNVSTTGLWDSGVLRKGQFRIGLLIFRVSNTWWLVESYLFAFWTGFFSKIFGNFPSQYEKNFWHKMYKPGWTHETNIKSQFCVEGIFGAHLKDLLFPEIFSISSRSRSKFCLKSRSRSTSKFSPFFRF